MTKNKLWRGLWLGVTVPAGLGVLTLSGCDSLLQNNQVPDGVTDPAVNQTPEGALVAYYGTLIAFSGALSNSVAFGGLFTDELRLGARSGGGAGAAFTYNGIIDRQDLSETSTVDSLYNDLNRLRGQANQAIGLLTDYQPDQPALKSHLYALEGYAELFLAEAFCSGIPLSTLDYKGDYTLQPGSTTTQVFTHALTLFDSALAYAGDSARVVDLVRVGQGRARLALGQYAEAAAAVAAVADGYRYDVRYGGDTLHSFTTNFISNGFYGSNPLYSVADLDGVNGLDYISSGDPRTAVVLVTPAGNNFGFAIYRPAKYPYPDSSSITFASAVEARLIEAEAALAAGDPATWLAKLNALRTDGTQNGSGVYNPGTGGVAGLAPLTDPGTTDGRVDLLFRERAFWLFLTGGRQGDLRRLIRQYGRDPITVYPAGRYPGPDPAYYQSLPTVPVPKAERDLNPNFTGCFSNDA